MKKLAFPLLWVMAVIPWVLGTSAQGQSSGRGEASMLTIQDPDPDPGAIDDSSSDYDVFYDRLSSDGDWSYDDDYGYVWQPNVAVSTSSWRPYADGHWVWTDRGWYWASDEDFGWATYHYGRWIRISGVGWVWVPGDEWAPAWVSWRHTDDDDYVGWAPLPPEATFTADVGVHSWCDSYYDIGPASFAFIRVADFCRPSYREFIAPPQQSFTIISRTQNITNIAYNNNVIYNYGPQFERVSQIVQRQGQQVPNYKINYVSQAQRTAAFTTTPQGNQLRVVAPPAKLKSVATTEPKTVKQLGKAEVDRGWQHVPPNQTQQIRQKFAQEASVPKSLPPKPPIPPQPQIQTAKPGGQGTAPRNATGPSGPNAPLPPTKAKETAKTAEQLKAEHPNAQVEKKAQPPAPGQPKEGQAHPKAATNPQPSHVAASKPPTEQPSHPPEKHVTRQTHAQPPSHPQPQHATQPPHPQHVAQASHPQHADQPHPQPQHAPQPHPQPQHQQQPHPQQQKGESKDKKKQH